MNVALYHLHYLTKGIALGTICIDLPLKFIGLKVKRSCVSCWPPWPCLPSKKAGRELSWDMGLHPKFCSIGCHITIKLS